MHEWDGQTPLEETMEALDTLIRQGKVRYVGCSNYSGWHIMKALGIANEHRYQRFVSQQIHYTLEARDAEYELLPISIDQASACWSGACSPAACSPASIAATSSPRRHAPVRRLDRTADPR